MIKIITTDKKKAKKLTVDVVATRAIKFKKNSKIIKKEVLRVFLNIKLSKFIVFF